MHFLSELIKSPQLKDPANNHKNIHRHFYRYSRGIFLGPVIKITRSKVKLTLKGSFEYEDLILEIVSRSISNPEDTFEITGVLISGGDISDTITSLGLDWKLKRSAGKTQKYKADIIDTIDNNILIESLEKFRKDSYYLLSFNVSPTCKVTTKKRIPQPSKKKVEDDVISKRIQFCSGIIANSEKNDNIIIDSAMRDFKSELPEQWKTIIISNNYKITDIELPKDVIDSKKLRIMAIRKGIMFRSVTVDGELIEKQYSIVV